MDSNAGANEVSEAGSRALETLTNEVSLECLMTGDRIPLPPPVRTTIAVWKTPQLLKEGYERFEPRVASNRMSHRM